MIVMIDICLKGVLIIVLSTSILCQNINIAEPDYEDEALPIGGRAIVPVFVNVYNHPKTGFSCNDKQAGQYYADPETKCAVYYVCIPTSQGGLSAQSFACPNGTIFSQATRVCASHDQVFCRLSERYYENIHGNIDSKGQEASYRPAALKPWQKNQPRNQAQAPVVAAAPPPQSQPQPQQSPPSERTSSVRRGSQSVVRTTSTTTAAPAPEYEYVDYADFNDTNAGAVARTRREAPEASVPARRKGQLPLPFDFLTQTHILTSFNCEDKVPGLAYADTETNCKMFHICIPFAKGKLRDYQLHCDAGKAFNQENSLCDHELNVKCDKTKKFYVYNKWFRPHQAKKDSWKRIVKKGMISKKS